MLHTKDVGSMFDSCISFTGILVLFLATAAILNYVSSPRRINDKVFVVGARPEAFSEFRASLRYISNGYDLIFQAFEKVRASLVAWESPNRFE